MPQSLWPTASLSLILAAAISVNAQDPAEAAPGDEPAAAQPPARGFAELQQRWKQLESELDALTTDYRQTTDVAQRREILARYQQRVAESQRLLSELRGAAIAEYQAAPNANEEVTRVLLGILDDALRRDRYDQAAEVADLLLINDCADKRLPDLAGRVAYCRDDFSVAEALLRRAEQANSLSPEGRAMRDEVATAVERWERERQLREREAAADDLPRVALETTKGRLVIELFENEAPQTVGNFVSLVERKYYDGLSFHRVLPGFMAQGGCPQGDGSGGPGYRIYCECVKDDHRHHFRGSLSMAHAGPDTGGSQFFLTFRRTPHLDGGHTVFGRVVEGLDVLEQIQRRNPTPGARGLAEPDRILRAEILRKRDHAYQATKVQ